MPLLSVKNLTTRFYTRNGVNTAVNSASFDVSNGETLAIVGESGSGKSVACYSLLNLVPQPPGKIETGEALFDGVDLLKMNGDALRDVRGSDIAMIFQDPMTSLNPFLTVGEQLVEPLIYHRNIKRGDAKKRAIEALVEVGINDAPNRFNHYPHEFSGGMRQRVMIAMALITEPKLLIADEPTTALDVTIQAQILKLIKELQQRRNIAVIFISHDLAVVSKIADKIAVMYQGEIVEYGSRDQIFFHTKHDYTKRLLASIPSGAKQLPNNDVLETQPSAETHLAPLLKVENLKTWFQGNSSGWFGRDKQWIKAVDDVSFNINRGDIVGLVGESGSGKSTIGRSILQLVPMTSGKIQFDNTELTTATGTEINRLRQRMQMIFQDPYASLNPRMTVFDTLAEPLLYHGIATKKQVTHQVLELMDDVGLARSSIRKYPHEFSGGQRQRIAIGRAIATKPELIIADEPVSALDVTIQAQVLELLLKLVEKHNLTMLFISHDLSVVRSLCDKVIVLYKGKIVEDSVTEELYQKAQHPYTQSLLSAVPTIAGITPN